MARPGTLVAITTCLLIAGQSAFAEGVSVTAGNLQAEVTTNSGRPQVRTSAPCPSKTVTVRSAGGSSSASVTTSSSDGQTVVAGAGSPGSVIQKSSCPRPTRRPVRK